MSANPIKVLYVAAWDRSGSTILSNVLGEIPGFFSTGEINNLWRRGLIENKLCGCQSPFNQCALWPTIIKQAFGDRDGIDPAAIEQDATRLTNADLALSWLPGGQQRLLAKCGDFLPTMQKLYSSIQSVTGAEMIIDASKNPAHGYMLSQLPGVEVHVIHLVRSPHGVAHSLMKKKLYDPDPKHPSYMERHGLIRSTLIWSAWNLLIENLWKNSGRYLRVRYEDFMARPKATVLNILEFAGTGSKILPFVGDHDVTLSTNHNVSGNPSRFKTGRVALELDNEWERNMKLQQKLLIDFLYFPILWRYGYLPAESIRHTTQTIPS